MAATLTAAGLAVALGCAVLVVVCWRSRTVLGGVLGVIRIPLALAGATHAAGGQAVLIAAMALVLGGDLFGLGRALERLLDAEPEDGTSRETAEPLTGAGGDLAASLQPDRSGSQPQR